MRCWRRLRLVILSKANHLAPACLGLAGGHEFRHGGEETCGKSHFILWRSKIYWCDRGDELDTPMEEVVQLVRNRLSTELVPYVSIADALQLSLEQCCPHATDWCAKATRKKARVSSEATSCARIHPTSK